MKSLLFATLVALAIAQPVWQNCESGLVTNFVNHDVTVTPFPPIAGQPLTVSFRDASMDKSTVELSYMGVVVAEEHGQNVKFMVPSSLPAETEYKLTIHVYPKNAAEPELCAVSSFQMSRMALCDTMIANLNKNQDLGWVAGRNEYFANMDIATAKKMMGVKKGLLARPAKKVYSPETVAALPTSFDSRQQWPNCTGPVLDQGRCGSCWAFGAAEGISDRMCISSGNSSFLQLAALDLTINDDGFINSGCQGGDPMAAWQWAQTKGLVTESCLPYGTWETPKAGPIPTCAAAKEPCMPNTFVNTPKADKTCANGANYNNDKHKLKTVYELGSVNDIMADMVAHGPVEAAFTVYEDFLTYKSGVYKHTSGQALGGHAIKVIGYGSLNGVAYWLCQNSWTTTWGNGGYFMIAKGVDECGIEDEVVGGTF